MLDGEIKTKFNKVNKHRKAGASKRGLLLL